MKINSIKFNSHRILGNLYIDFCYFSKKPLDTIIIAGENGTGKSTLLNELYKVVTYKMDSPVSVVCSNNDEKYELAYFQKELNHNLHWYVKYNEKEMLQDGNDFKHAFPFTGIYSDVDINFKSSAIAAVTSNDVDITMESRKSDGNIASGIQQLIVDVQALDDAQLAYKVRAVKGSTIKVDDELTTGRMTRFTKAFSHIFEDLKYDKIENLSGKKKIVFKRKDTPIYLDDLSSGEKQIVYRGSFMLKDINALTKAIVFIDEPEISLHPNWQSMIMDYYKGIFTDISGKQSSQIFAVTHSPFIIHNNNRRNDKVIVMVRNKHGNIIISDKPEYYKCNSIEAVHDAFNITTFLQNQQTVYLEGRTDEKYFKKACEVFEYNVLPFQFKWIGYIDDRGQEANTGKDSLDKAAQFLISKNMPIKNVCLYDCDTSKKPIEKNNLYIRVIPTFQNSKRMKKGVENALVLDDIDITQFYSKKIKDGDYGDDNTIIEFNKMACCNSICEMETIVLEKVFQNLKVEIKKLLELFGGA